MIALHFDKPIISWKYYEVKNTFNMPHLPNSMLSLAHLKHAQNTLAFMGQNNLTQSLFCNKALNISCNLLGTVLFFKKKKVGRVQNGCIYINCLPSSSHVWMGAVARWCYLASQENLIHSPEKDQNWKMVFTECLLLSHYKVEKV